MFNMLERLGFKKTLEIPFEMPGHDGVRNEKFFVFYQPRDAILLAFETYLESGVGNGVFYFNWKRGISESSVYLRRVLSSGGHWSMLGKRDVFVGNEYFSGGNTYRVSRVVSRLKRYGTFVSPWIETQPVSLTHCGDSPNNHALITDERVMMLPPSVRKVFLL